MTPVRLTYFSRNRVDRLSGPMNDRVAEILATSVFHNRRDDVTGALVHDGKWFAQVLEGEETVVSRTFERILRDGRHSDVTLVKMQPVAARQFEFWWMASVAWSEDIADIFRHYGEGDRFDPQLMPSDRLGDLIEALVSRTAQLQGKAKWTRRNATNAA
jgi:hypothetical protein